MPSYQRQIVVVLLVTGNVAGEQPSGSIRSLSLLYSMQQTSQQHVVSAALTTRSKLTSVPYTRRLEPKVGRF